MRQLILLLTLCSLLWGCAASPPAVPAETAAPAATLPTVCTTAPPTEPVDPMKLLMDAMTLEEKVGQLFLARCPAVQAADDISAFRLGGYILFGQDFENETPDSLREKIRDYQAVSPIPLLIAVDEEGGTVCRVSRYPAFRSSPFRSPRDYFASGGMEAVLAAETEKAALLQDLGINVNMGPVCDIAIDPNAFMYRRSLGQSPEETGRFAAAAVQILENHRTGSVLKHFPGYGSNADTHEGQARDDRPLEALEGADLIPFAAGIQAGCDAILVSHSIVTALDGDNPASLSPAVHHYLRHTMGFDGVIVTDDLVMEAIAEAYGPEESAVLAVLAGNDLLCSSEYRIQYPAVLEAVKSGRIPMEQLEASVLRILLWKKELGLIF